MSLSLLMLSLWDGIKRVSNSTIADSLDDQPLTTHASQFLGVGAFPYERLPTHSKVVAYLLQPSNVLLCIGLYLLSEKPVQGLRRLLFGNANNHNKNNQNQKPTVPQWFTNLVALHNFGLCLFSLWIAVLSWYRVLSHYQRHGWFETYCDPNDTLWIDANFGTLCTMFYLSKYYEFVDTWILVLKGKPASFLQTYHHAGIVLCMYGGVTSHSSWLLFVVLLNSVIHTVMYWYFCVKTLFPHVQIKSAKYLTMAQIGQFLIGIVGTAGILVMGNDCDSQSSRLFLWGLQLYGYGLIALFVTFANRKYKQS